MRPRGRLALAAPCGICGISLALSMASDVGVIGRGRGTANSFYRLVFRRRLEWRYPLGGHPNASRYAVGFVDDWG